jgi:hypothetical protein
MSLSRSLVSGTLACEPLVALGQLGEPTLARHATGVGTALR